MKSASILAALPLAAAWPAAMNPEVMNAVKRNVNPNILDIKGSGVNLHRKNTGLQHPDVPFDAKEQFIDTSDGSKWAFDPPGPDDKRGECPGLNACANHNICPHSGIWTQAETIQGLQTAYGMTPELAEGLAVISILLSGDILAGTWSIGTGYKSSAPGLLSDPKGLTGLHNKYEGDASIGRGDAYLNGGSVSVFQFRSWESLFKVIDIDGDDNFSPYKSAWHNAYTREYSIENNPYYFSGEFSGLVTSAVRGFVYGFMSNHSAENPGGYLNKDIINSFFAISGEEGNWSLKYGYERIPENWYRRPYGAAGQYGHSLADVFIELAASAAEFPQSLNLGGNTGTTNSFTGLSLSNLTGGLYDASALTDPNKLACFAYFMAEQADVDQFNGALTVLNTAITALTGQLASVFKQFECPQLSNYNSNLYNLFPGYKYTGNPNSNSGDPGSTPQVRSGQVIYQKTQKED